MKPRPQPAYRRMTWTDRLITEKLYNNGSSYRVIAEVTGFAVSSVYREIQHGLYEHMGVETSRLPKGTSIERRPEAISTRESFGHWEQDSVIGKAKGIYESLLVLIERKTRYEIILRAQGKTSAATVQALNILIPMFPAGTFQTITVDNGSEFQDCHGMEHDEQGNKRLSVYYCHPYCSCERGSNERNNRIIRRFLPKGKSLRQTTQEDCNRIAAFMNDMPRKILNYSTARELFEQELAALTAAVESS